MSLWFIEEFALGNAIQTQIQIKTRLHTEQSKFQKIEVFDTTAFGRMLVIDGAIMCTEYDEKAYHEMITHVPMFAHKDPKRVLIVGGGDGGTLREVVKHPQLEQVDVCELDERVVRVSQEFLPSMASQYNHPKLSLNFEDGIKWVKDHKGEYDVIIVDSTDPVGPGAILFTQEFFNYCYDALNETGILVNQAEDFHVERLVILKRMLGYGEKFKVKSYYYTVVPTYPGGQIGFTFFSKKYLPFENFDERTNGDLTDFNFRYWTHQFHKAAFQLPRFAFQELGIKSYS